MSDNPCRQWYQFSLRTMFACMTVAAIGCAAVVPMVKWYERSKAEERRINEELRRDFELAKKRFPKIDELATLPTS